MTAAAAGGGDSHLFDEGGVRVGEDVPFLSAQVAAGDVEVDPQVGVVPLHGHADVLEGKGAGTAFREPAERRGGDRVTLMVAMWNGVAIPKTGMMTVSYFLSMKIFMSLMSFSRGI